jgi:transcriptional regulator with XRE-family HTH domain
MLNNQTSSSISEADLPARLKAFREVQGLSQRGLAAALGTAAYAVRRWEAGSSRPSVDLAAKLTEIGFGPVHSFETNQATRSRAKDPLSHHRIALELDVLPGATLPAWARNGPPDQEGFHRKLIELQLTPRIGSLDDPERLSLLEFYAPDKRTLQSLLEDPKPTAAAWNSNYGSHGWHRYVGRFPPHLVRSLLNHFNAGPNSVVCDPFFGSGTTAVECRLLGIPFVGIEICALSHLMGRVKAAFEPRPIELSHLAHRYKEFMAEEANRLSDGYSVSDVLARQGNVIPSFANVDKWFTPEALFGVSLTMEFASRLDGFHKDALLLALSAKMRSIGNLDVDVVRAEYSRKPRERVDVGTLVFKQLCKMAGSISRMLNTHSATIGEPSTITLIEASALDAEIAPRSVDCIITSPPYGVEAISYLRTHLLSYRSLASVLKHDPYDTRDKTIGSEYLEEFQLPSRLSIAEVSPTFRSYFEGLGDTSDKNERLRRVGMMKFFEDMHVMGQRMSGWLKPGGHMAFVIGNKRLGETTVPASAIIEEAFASSGLSLYESIRHKLKTNNSNSQVPWQERIIQEEATMLFAIGS